MLLSSNEHTQRKEGTALTAPNGRYNSVNAHTTQQAVETGCSTP